MKARLLQFSRDEWSAGRAAIGGLLPWRAVLLWSLPALLVAILLRGWICVEAPTAFINSDVRQILATSEGWANKGDLEISSRRTFLGPMLYAIPVFLRLPALPSIAIGQHALGVLFVWLTGVLSALWFRRWRIWIVPLTLLVAVDPFLLIYEHVALPDYLYAFFLLATLVVATIFHRRPGYLTLAWLLVMLTFLVGARQEGRFYALLALALVGLAFYGDRRRLVIGGIATLLFTVWAFRSTETTQGGQMLLTSTLHLMGDESKVAPGFPAQLAALREKVRAAWTLYPAQHNETRKKVRAEARIYMRAHALDHHHTDDLIDNFCKRVAMETVRAHPLEIPQIALHKFLATHNEVPSEPIGLGEHNERQLELFYPKGTGKAKSAKLLKLYYGRTFGSEEEMTEFLDRVYPAKVVEPLVRWEKSFLDAMARWRLPDQIAGQQMMIGVPVLYLLAIAGILGLAAADPKLRGLLLLLLAFIAAVSVMVFAAANARARYRISLEAFWWIGLFALLDVIWLNVRRLTPRRRPAPEESAAG